MGRPLGIYSSKKTNEPKTQLPQWIRNPIDSFILDTLKQKGLHPSPEADRRTLIRKVLGSHRSASNSQGN